MAGILALIVETISTVRNMTAVFRLVADGYSQTEITHMLEARGILTLLLGDVPWLKILAVIIFAPLFVPTFSLGVRRFNDAGVYWGWYVAIVAIGWSANLIPLEFQTVRALIGFGVVVATLVIAVQPSKARS